MWIMFTDAFLSIVDKAQDRKNDLVVRARRDGDIEKVFEGAKVRFTPGVDYLYRAEISRKAVADAIAGRIMDISYSNHKGETKDDQLHSAYMRVWSVMCGLQKIAPYTIANRRGGRQGKLL